MRQKLISFPLFIIERDFQQGEKHAVLIILFTSHLGKCVMDFIGPLTGKKDDLMLKPALSRWFTAPCGRERYKQTIGHLKHSRHHYEVVFVELFTNFAFKTRSSSQQHTQI